MPARSLALLPVIAISVLIILPYGALAALPRIREPNMNADVFMETASARMEISTDETSVVLWAKKPDGSIYTEEALALRLSHVSRGSEAYDISVPQSWIKTSLTIGTANCEQIGLRWLLSNNATFRLMWMTCDRDETLTTYAEPRLNQTIFAGLGGNSYTLNFGNSFNKSIIAAGFKLSCCDNWNTSSRDYILVNGSIQTDFIIRDVSPFQVLSIGPHDAVVAKEGRVTFETPQFFARIIVPTWGVGDYDTAGVRQFDADFHFDLPAFDAVSNAIADGSYSSENKDKVQSIQIPLFFRSGATRTFAYYDPDFIVLFSGNSANSDGDTSSTAVGIAAGVSVGAVAAIGIVVAALVYVRRNRKARQSQANLEKKLPASKLGEPAGAVQGEGAPVQLEAMATSSDKWMSPKTQGINLLNKK